MHFFESRTIGQIVQLTLAALYHTAIGIIKVCKQSFINYLMVNIINYFVIINILIWYNLGEKP